MRKLRLRLLGNIKTRATENWSWTAALELVILVFCWLQQTILVRDIGSFLVTVRRRPIVSFLVRGSDVV